MAKAPNIGLSWPTSIGLETSESAGGAVTATGAFTLPVPTTIGVGTLVRTATGGLTLPIPTTVGVGVCTGLRTATGAFALLVPTTTGIGTLVRTATGGLTLPIPTMAGTATVTVPVFEVHTATGSFSIPLPRVYGIGQFVGDRTATGALALPLPSTAGIGVVISACTSRTFMVDIEMDGNRVLNAAAFYFGPVDTDGTWRFIPSGSDLVVQLRESGTYNTKGTWTP